MIIEFIETSYQTFTAEDGTDFTMPGACSMKTFLVDTDKISEYLKTEPKAYQRMLYVGPMIQRAQNGERQLRTTFANSFTDMPDWYRSLFADSGTMPDCTVFVEIV